MDGRDGIDCIDGKFWEDKLLLDPDKLSADVVILVCELQFLIFNKELKLLRHSLQREFEEVEKLLPFNKLLLEGQCSVIIKFLNVDSLNIFNFLSSF